MGAVELFIGVIFVLALGVGITLTTSANSPPEFFWTRVCYIVAAVALAAGYFLWISQAPRFAWTRVLLGSIVGISVFVGLPGLLQWVNVRATAALALSKESAPSAHSIPVKKTPAPFPVGPVAFVQFQPEIHYHKHSKKTDIQLQVALENTTDQLVKFRISSLRGEANGKTVPDPENPVMAATEGFIYPHKQTILRYQRIDAIDVPQHQVSGYFDYEIFYESVPPNGVRRTGRRVIFEFPVPDVSDTPIGNARVQSTTVTFANEVEE